MNYSTPLHCILLELPTTNSEFLFTFGVPCRSCYSFYSALFLKAIVLALCAEKNLAEFPPFLFNRSCCFHLVYWLHLFYSGFLARGFEYHAWDCISCSDSGCSGFNCSFSVLVVLILCVSNHKPSWNWRLLNSFISYHLLYFF